MFAGLGAVNVNDAETISRSQRPTSHTKRVGAVRRIYHRFLRLCWDAVAAKIYARRCNDAALSLLTGEWRKLGVL